MIQSEVSLNYFDTLFKYICKRRSILWQCSGKDNGSDMDMSGDDMHTYTLSWSLFFSLLPSSSLMHLLSLVLSHFSSVILQVLVSLFHTQTDIIQPVLNGGRGTERYGAKCSTLGISWLKSLFLFMFRKIYIHSNTIPFTRSRVYLLKIKCHRNTPFLRIRYLRHRPPAAVRRLHIEVFVHKLFTTISSKNCTEHVHNFLKPVRYIHCWMEGTFQI